MELSSRQKEIMTVQLVLESTEMAIQDVRYNMTRDVMMTEVADSILEKHPEINDEHPLQFTTKELEKLNARHDKEKLALLQDQAGRIKKWLELNE